MSPRELWEQADLRMQKLINDVAREGHATNVPNPPAERDDEAPPPPRTGVIQGT